MFQEKAFPYSHGKFLQLDSLIDYEKAWHKHVYEFSKADIKNKVRYSNINMLLRTVCTFV